MQAGVKCSVQRETRGSKPCHDALSFSTSRLCIPSLCLCALPLIPPRLTDIHQHLGNEGHLYAQPNGSFLLRLHLCFLRICCSSSSLFFFLCIHVSPSLLHLSRTRWNQMDKCGSMVTQIPGALERAKINHFSPLPFISYLSPSLPW